MASFSPAPSRIMVSSLEMVTFFALPSAERSAVSSFMPVSWCRSRWITWAHGESGQRPWQWLAVAAIVATASVIAATALAMAAAAWQTSEMTVALVSTAMSCSVALRLSPKPGALTAATLTPPLSLLTTCGACAACHTERRGGS
eukprot:scaffold203753_cov28-Tisochrysis_lutea.AAC.2